MPDRAWNPWKMTAIGIGLAVAVAVVTGVVVASWPDAEPDRSKVAAIEARRSAKERKAAAASKPAVVAAAPVAPPAAPAAPSALPSQVAIDACNDKAAAQASGNSKTVEIVKDGAIGAAIGAAVGAAGGAIADGGSGAGKGAVIGGLVGAGGGVLYGVNENRKSDARYRDAYASCMRARGYTG